MKQFPVLTSPPWAWRLVLFLAFPPVSQSVQAQALPGRAEQIRRVETGLLPSVRFVGDSVWTMAARMQHYGVPGVSIAVIYNSKVIWTKAYGVVDRASNVPVTTRTLFQAASISKAVTAYGALRQVEQGRLHLDGNVNDELRNWHLPDNAFTQTRKVTLRGLLSHTAGVGVDGFPGYTTTAPVPTLRQVLEGEAPANTGPVRVEQMPGTGFRYSGGGYCIAQQLMLDAAGTTDFAALMQQLVLGPLGMKASTYAQPLPAAWRAQAATGYGPDGTAVAGQWHTYPEMSPAGLWTTAADLARFPIDVQRTLKGKSRRVLSPAMAATWLTPVLTDYAAPGPFVRPLGDQQQDVYFEHSGWNEGFSSQFVAHRDKGYGVVVLTNANQPLFVNEVIRAVTETYHWANYNTPAYPRPPLTAADTVQLTGRYRAGPLEALQVVGRGSRLFLKEVGEDPVELFKVADQTYMRRSWEAPVQLAVNPADATRHLLLQMPRTPPRYEHARLAPGEQVPFDGLLRGALEPAVEAYQQAQTKNPDEAALQEGHLNHVGYQLLKERQPTQALRVFTLATRLYPQSSNAFDSLAEACLRNGDKTQAQANYARVLALDPHNSNAANMLRELAEK
ncbi:hypothetical protein GCM10027422_34620 [Hymenobacter arcticus]